MSKGKTKKLKMKKSFKRMLVFLLFVTLMFFTLKKVNINSVSEGKSFIKELCEKAKKREEEKEREKRYNECISKALPEENFNEQTIAKKDEIVNYVKSNGLKYTYEDLIYGYQINYGENDPLYGASLIKLVLALYLIDKDVDLSQTIKYESKYHQAYSEGMDKHKYGEDISLETLLRYSITYSDNTAYLMLYTFIGRNNMKEYAQSLGATAIFTLYNDNFASQTTHDTNIYLKRAYELMNEKENAKILKEAMTNDRKNRLNIPDKVSIAHKYGSYNEYFHNVGINYNDNYTISVLTTKGENGSVKYINNTSLLTYEFNQLYKENLKDYCSSYANKKD